MQERKPGWFLREQLVSQLLPHFLPSPSSLISSSFLTLPLFSHLSYLFSPFSSSLLSPFLSSPLSFPLLSSLSSYLAISSRSRFLSLALTMVLSRPSLLPADHPLPVGLWHLHLFFFHLCHLGMRLGCTWLGVRNALQERPIPWEKRAEPETSLEAAKMQPAPLLLPSVKQ